MPRIDSKFINWRMAVRESTDLTSTQKLICYTLNTYMNDNHDCAWPAASTLAGQCGLGRSTVLRQLSELCKKGWLIRELVFDNAKGQRPSKYTVTIPESVERQVIGGAPERPPSLTSETPQSRQRDTNSSGNSTKNSKDQNTRGKSSRFVPPCVSEVREYCERRGNQIDPEEFIDFYTASDWMRGKNKIKDWKACVRTWEKNREKSRSVRDRKQHIADRITEEGLAAVERLSGRPVPEVSGNLQQEVERPSVQRCLDDLSQG